MPALLTHSPTRGTTKPEIRHPTSEIRFARNMPTRLTDSPTRGTTKPEIRHPTSEIRLTTSEIRFTMLVALLAGSASALAPPKAPDPPGEPKLVSIHPFTGQHGAAFDATVRGTGLREATAVVLEDAPFTAVIEGAETDKTGKTPM